MGHLVPVAKINLFFFYYFTIPKRNCHKKQYRLSSVLVYNPLTIVNIVTKLDPNFFMHQNFTHMWFIVIIIISNVFGIVNLKVTFDF